jgi:hypothetical protein
MNAELEIGQNQLLGLLMEHSYKPVGMCEVVRWWFMFFHGLDAGLLSHGLGVQAINVGVFATCILYSVYIIELLNKDEKNSLFE